MKLFWIKGALGVTCLVICVLAILGREQKHFITLKVKRKNISLNVKIKGTLEALKTNTLRCPNWGYKIVKLVKEGSYVKKNQTVIEFEDNRFQYEYEKSKLELEARKAERDESIAKLEAEKEKLLLEIESAKTDKRITELQLKDLKSHPRKDDLDIARKEYEQAKMVMVIAEQEYLRIKKGLNKNIINLTEVRQLELKKMQAISAFEKAKLNFELVSSGVNSLELKKLGIQRDLKIFELRELKKDMPAKIKQFQSDIEKNKARIEVAKSNVDKAKENLSKTKLKAPSNGIVVYCVNWGSKVKVGNSYGRNAGLIEIPDLEVMELEGRVPEHKIDMVKVGQKVSIFLDAFPRNTFKGTVTKIGKIAVDISERNVMGFLDKKNATGIKVFDINIKLDNSSFRLLPKMPAIAMIHIKTIENILAIPNMAIIKEKEKHFVRILKSLGRVIKKPVVLGQDNGLETVIKKGLDEGDLIILE